MSEFQWTTREDVWPEWLRERNRNYEERKAQLRAEGKGRIVDLIEARVAQANESLAEEVFGVSSNRHSDTGLAALAKEVAK